MCISRVCDLIREEDIASQWSGQVGQSPEIGVQDFIHVSSIVESTLAFSFVNSNSKELECLHHKHSATCLDYTLDFCSAGNMNNLSLWSIQPKENRYSMNLSNVRINWEWNGSLPRFNLILCDIECLLIYFFKFLSSYLWALKIKMCSCMCKSSCFLYQITP